MTREDTILLYSIERLLDEEYITGSSNCKETVQTYFTIVGAYEYVQRQVNNGNIQYLPYFEILKEKILKLVEECNTFHSCKR